MIRLQRSEPAARDIAIVEADGTVFSMFGKTGHMKSVNRTRFSTGSTASSAAFLVTDADQGESDAARAAPFGLMFLSEVEGVQKLALIERFVSRADADASLALVRAAVRRHIGRTRAGTTWRTVVVWVGGPVLALTVGMSVVRYLDSHNGAMDVLNSLMRSPAQAGLLQHPALPSPAGLPELALAPTAATGAVPQSSTNGVADGLLQQRAEQGAQGNAVITPQMTSIHFGLDKQPPQKTLYVYADPNCPACRRFESHMDNLTKDFSVYVLPVAYQNGSVSMAGKILCASDPKKKWTEVMSQLATGQAVSGTECESGTEGIRANMQAFDSLGFTQTPRVVSGSGYVFAAGATASDIRSQAALH